MSTMGQPERATQDRVIALYRDELATVRRIKQGMMQDLLTGRVRLPVDGARTVG